MAKLDAADYKKTVLGPWSKDDAKKTQLRQVLADLEGAASAQGCADSVDLATLFALPPGELNAAQLREHSRQLEMAFNKATIFPAADLLERIKAQLTEKGLFEDPKFWEQRLANRDQNRSKALSDAITELAAAIPLGAMSRAEMSQRLSALGVHEIAPDELERVAQQAGLLVFESFEIPDDAVLTPVKAPWKKIEPEYRSIFDVLLLHKPHSNAAEFRFLDELSANGSPITLADVKAAHSRSQSVSDSETIQHTQKYLGALSGVTNEDLLQQIVLRTMWRQTKTLLDIGLPPTLVLKRLREANIAEKDALRIVAVVSTQGQGAGATIGVDNVRAYLARGDLSRARYALEALKDDPSSNRDREELAAQIAQRERQKAAAVDRFQTAAAKGDYIAAELALQEAVRCDEADDSLNTLRLQLPVPAPRVVAQEGPSGVRISWVASYSALRFTVARNVSATGESRILAEDLDGTTFDDTDPLVGEHVSYSVTARRPGGASSEPGMVEIVALTAVDDLRILGTDENSVSLAWSAHPRTESVRIDVLGPDGQYSVTPPRAMSTYRVEKLRTGAPHQFDIRAVYWTSTGSRESDARSISATPRPPARPVMDLAIDVPEGATDEFNATWSEIPNFRVELWAFDRESTLTVGETKSVDELSKMGGRSLPLSLSTQLNGLVTARFPGFATVAQVCPLVVTENGLLIGSPVLTGGTPPVANLRAEDFADHVQLTWDWPDGVSLVEVRWFTSAAVPRQRRVTRNRYRLDGAVRLHNPGDITKIDVATVVKSSDEEWVGRRTRVPRGTSPQRAEVSWDLNISKRFGRATRVTGTFRSSAPVITEIGLFISQEKSLPLRPEQCQLLAKLPVDFTESHTSPFVVNLDRTRSPFWIRAFALEPRSTNLVDPPTSQMKG